MNSFLIVRLGSLGDVIHGIPVAAALRNEFPNGRIDWMVAHPILDSTGRPLAASTSR